MAANQGQVPTGGDLVQETVENPSEELGVMIDDLLNDLSGKFNSVASEITAKMDDMSRRIDNLEASMQSMQKQNVEGQEA